MGAVVVAVPHMGMLVVLLALWLGLALRPAGCQVIQQMGCRPTAQPALPDASLESQI